jgi:hypothetical protein
LLFFVLFSSAKGYVGDGCIPLLSAAILIDYSQHAVPFPAACLQSHKPIY